MNIIENIEFWVQFCVQICANANTVNDCLDAYVCW